MYTTEELLGSKVVTGDGSRGTVIEVIQDEETEEPLQIRLEEGGIFEATTLRLVERQMYHSRLTKPIEKMNEAELKDYLIQLRHGRTQAMVTSRDVHGMKKSRKGQPKAPGEKKARTTKKKATTKADDISKLEGILSPEAIAKIKERLKQNGGI